MFRKKALERLSSPEQLDKLLIIVKPSGWLALLTTLIIVVCAAIWASSTLIPIQIDTRGIITTPDGLYKLRTKFPGVVQSILVKKGDFISEGVPIAQIYNKELEAEISQTQAEIQALKKVLSDPATKDIPNTLPSKTLEDLNATFNRLLKEKASIISQEETLLSSMEDDLLAGKISKDTLEEQRKKIKSLKAKLEEDTLSCEKLIQEIADAQTLSASNSLNTRLLEKEDLLLSLEKQQAELTIRSPVAGIILRFNTNEGEHLQSGQRIVTIERPFTEGQEYEILAFVPIELKGVIMPDMPVKISLPPLNDAQFESINGVISSISPYAMSDAEIDNVTISPQWASYLLPSTKEPCLGVIVRPSYDFRELNYKKLMFNSKEEPVIRSGDICNLKITIAYKRPLDFLLSHQ